MHIIYRTKGVCSSRIEFDLSADSRVHNIQFWDGCNGNLKAISILAEGLTATELVSKLRGNCCGHRSTSCADQLARAVSDAAKKL